MFNGIRKLETLLPGFNERILNSQELIAFSEKALGVPCIGTPDVSSGLAYVNTHTSSFRKSYQNGNTSTFIFYNDQLPESLQTIILAHEIAHIFFAHWNENDTLAFSEDALFCRHGIECEASLVSLLAMIPNGMVITYASVDALFTALCKGGEYYNHFGELHEGFLYRLSQARIRTWKSFVRRIYGQVPSMA